METQIKIHNFKKIILFLFISFGFLFFYTSHAQAATLYYNDATSDLDWNTLGNWWSDAGLSVPAISLPGVSDDVVIVGVDVAVASNSGPAASVNTIALYNNSVISGMTITVANGAFFYDSSYNATTITGSATFNNTSSNNGGTITGDAIFNDTSYNDGTVSGDATFTAVAGTTITLTGSQVWGTVGGVAKNASGNPITDFVFTDSSQNYTSIVGNPIFNNFSSNHGTITGNSVFNDSSYNNGSIVGITTFNGTSRNYGNITGTTTFNSSSYNGQNITITGDAYFYGTSHNHGGTVSGNAFFYDSSYNDTWSLQHAPFTTYTATIEGNATFNNSSYNNNGLVLLDATFNNSSYNNGDIEGNATFNNLSYNNGYVAGDATFNHATGGVLSLIGSAAWGYVEGLVKDVSGNPITEYIFNDDSYNNATIAGNALFYDFSYNNDYVTGDACFAATATNNGTVDGTTTTPCPILLPIVATQTATPLTRTTETLNGDILSTGGEHPSERGFDYGSDPTLTTVIGTITDTAGQPFAAGSFSANIADLTCGTTYYARAYAINSINTGFGAIVPFTTVACPQGSGPLLTYTSGSSGGGNTVVLPQPSPTPLFIETICKAGEYFSTTTGRPCTSFENTPVSSCPITITLRLGNRGAQVKCLQTGLKIVSDGIFGLKTKAAVILFQKSKNLIPDGVFGPKSRALWK